jgi:hypothetical protein
VVRRIEHVKDRALPNLCRPDEPRDSGIDRVLVEFAAYVLCREKRLNCKRPLLEIAEITFAPKRWPLR